MWAIFIGLGLGIFHVLLLERTVSFLTTSKSNIPVGVLISVGKLAVILLVLWLLAKYVSIASVLWCAAGLGITMVVLPIIKNVCSTKKLQKEEQEGEVSDK